MTYHNATKFLLSSPEELPESVSGTRLRRFWSAMGNPQKKLTYFRLAGSSGKTVCSEMLTSVFRHSDIPVGCLTMPLREQIRENIRINHIPLSIDETAECVGQVYSLLKSLNKDAASAASDSEPIEPIILTKYEILLCAALIAFQKHQCRLCIIESGNLPCDPTRYLPAPIAAAICGTIPNQSKKDILQIRSYLCHGIQEIVSAPQNQEAYKIISQNCASINCRLTIPAKSELSIEKVSLGGSEFVYRNKHYRLSLCGQFQITNAMVTLEILQMLTRHGFTVSDEAVARGLRELKISSKFEILSVEPTVIADSTYSPEAIETVCRSMADFREQIGTCVSLCLPSDALAKQYRAVLPSQGFAIDTVLLHDVAEPSEKTDQDGDYIYSQRLRDTVRYVLDHKNKGSVWLISGPHPFTEKIRYELLQTMGF